MTPFIAATQTAVSNILLVRRLVFVDLDLRLAAYRTIFLHSSIRISNEARSVSEPHEEKLKR
jgi:hypothetical protein